MSLIASADIMPAWDDPIHDAHAAFRCALNALSHPGRPHKLPFAFDAPSPLGTAVGAICLALCDFDTPVWLDNGAKTGAVLSWLRFHAGCPITDRPETARFAVITAPAAGFSLSDFAQGTPEYPDRSATLLIRVPAFEGPLRMLEGPGIEHSAPLRVSGLPDDFDSQWHETHARFPLGVDIIFCCGDMIVGLPRTAKITVGAQPAYGA